MRKFKKFFLLIFLLFLQGSSLLAQQDSVQSPMKLKRGFYEDILVIKGDFSKLNPILTQHGFLPLDQWYSGMGIGFSARQKIKTLILPESYFFIMHHP